MPKFETNFGDPEVALLLGELTEIFARNELKTIVHQPEDLEMPVVLTLGGVLKLKEGLWDVNLTDNFSTETGKVISLGFGGYMYELSHGGIVDMQQDAYISSDNIHLVRRWLQATKWSPVITPSLDWVITDEQK